MKYLLMSIFLAAITLVGSSAYAAEPLAEPLRHVRIEDPNAQDLSLHLQRQGFDVLEGSVTDHQLEVIVSVAGLQDLLAAGYAPTTLAVGRPFRDIQTERQAGLSVPTGYPDLSEILAQLTETATNYPEICQLVDLTESYGTPPTMEGRHLYALKISDNVMLDEDEPAFLMVSNHHAREIVTPVLALHAIEQLTTQYGTDSSITNIVNTNEIWIAPVWNPDGYEFVFNTDNMWRKNRHVFPTGIGVDQNRNYPQGWYNACSGSTDPDSEIFKGLSPASESETQTMIAWSLDRNFAKVLDYHSYGREVLHGYSCWDHPFDDYLEEKAITLATQAGYDGDHRAPSADGEHYQWQFGVRGALAFLMETQTDFQPSYQAALNEADLVWPGTRWLLQQPIPLRGHVTNASNGDPIEATISFPTVAFEHDETSNSNDRFGRYHAFFPDGWYDVAFDAEGFEPQIIPDVFVNPAFPSPVNAAMVPLLSGVGDNNPGGDGLSVLVNSSTGVLHYEITNPSQVNIELFDLRGALMNTLVEEYLSAGQYEVTWPRKDQQGQTMASGMYFYRIVAGEAVRRGKVVLIK